MLACILTTPQSLVYEVSLGDNEVIMLATLRKQCLLLMNRFPLGVVTLTVIV